LLDLRLLRLLGLSLLTWRLLDLRLGLALRLLKLRLTLRLLGLVLGLRLLELGLPELGLPELGLLRGGGLLDRSGGWLLLLGCRLDAGLRCGLSHRVDCVGLVSAFGLPADAVGLPVELAFRPIYRGRVVSCG
jgi:hypothetical protein